MTLRSVAITMLFLGTLCSLLPGTTAQGRACKVNSDCPSRQTCCNEQCMDPSKSECLANGEVCDKASVCTSGTFTKTCCPFGTSCIKGQCGLTCGAGNCKTFCPAAIAFCTNGQCVANGPLCEFPDNRRGNLDTNYYPCARGHSCTDAGKNTVGCCPTGKVCGDPEKATCCDSYSDCKNGRCVARAGLSKDPCNTGFSRIGGKCCPKAQVCGTGKYRTCCAKGQACSLGQCVLPAAAKDDGKHSKLCGTKGLYCAVGSLCVKGVCVLEAKTCGGTCCASGSVCVISTTGPICCTSQNACGRLGLDRDGKRTPQSCCAAGSRCLPSGLCSGAKVLGSGPARAAPAAGSFNVSSAVAAAGGNRAGGAPGASPRPAATSPVPNLRSPSPRPAASPAVAAAATAPAPAGAPSGARNLLDTIFEIFG